jgi:hypothetical protein
MVATPDIIPSDLTLEIGEDVSPDEFLTLARAFFGYVKEISALVAPEGGRIDWTVHIKEGSGLIGVNPSPAVAREVIRNVYIRTANAVRSVAHGQIENADLPESALAYLRTISDLSTVSKTRRRELRLWVERKPIEIDDAIARVIAEDWRAAYSDYGLVEGRLEAIQDHGKLEIRIRDAAFRQTVRCFFPEEKLPQVFELFRKRVEVSGIVHYRRNGVPISIDVVNIERLPDDSELPTAADVRGILGAA